MRRIVLLALAVACLAGCRSPRIAVTVENRTGAAVELLEVDYPSASFGVDRLAAEASYNYRIQIRGSGPVRVQYMDPATHRQFQIAGPTLQERQAGGLQIVLLPGGKADFRPSIAPAR